MQNVADAAFEARKAELKGDGKAGRWFSPLELHVLPKLGKVPVEDIDQRDIETVLMPLWHTKAETARKALNRLGIVLKHGAAMGYDVDLQATLDAIGDLFNGWAPSCYGDLVWRATEEWSAKQPFV